MALKHNLRNILIRNMPAGTGARSQPAPARPANAALGSTAASAILYGSTRGTPVFTAQQRYYAREEFPRRRA